MGLLREVLSIFVALQRSITLMGKCSLDARCEIDILRMMLWPAVMCRQKMQATHIQALGVKIQHDHFSSWQIKRTDLARCVLQMDSCTFRTLGMLLTFQQHVHQWKARLVFSGCHL